MIRFGIICPSEIAFRRFLPALQQVDDCCFVGVAIASPDEWFGKDNRCTQLQIEEQQQNEYKKAQHFIDNYGGELFLGYESLIKSDKVDVVYIPLPPALHYKWAMSALKSGKHVFLEKPFTTSLEDTNDLLTFAERNNLAVHENYMFVFHKQISALRKIVESGEIGKVRLHRISFGFPKRAINDFRYNKQLGGGALLDCGGYTLKLASILLGDSARIVSATSFYEEGCDVDVFGTAELVNNQGVVAQVSFGMDNEYKCELESWGSLGTLHTNRVLTAPVGFSPELMICKGGNSDVSLLPSDDSFGKSIKCFLDCISDEANRHESYSIIRRQSELVENFITLSNLK